MADLKPETLLSASGDLPAAIVLRELLTPVEGRDGVFFPPTFAAAENKTVFAGGYNIDVLGTSKNVCLVDSVGSQANRIEPMFAEPEFADLVPQIVIEAGSKKVNLLEAGHRAGDAIVRCTELQAELNQAFKDLRAGNAVPLAKLAPTSLLFGVWDSRDTQAKAPRLLASTIRAFDVAKLTRSAQYTPAAEYVEEGLLDDTDDKDAYSQRGFGHVPATASHGGVIASGEIRREVTLQLAALRLLRGPNLDETQALRAYLLGLALTAFSRPAVGYLRQGCNLVLDAERPGKAEVVFNSGKREAFSMSAASAQEFARKAAKAFGVGKSRNVKFDPDVAKKDLEGDKEEKAKKAAKKAAKKTAKEGSTK
jgi:CRISPR-associated protein Csb1